MKTIERRKGGTCRFGTYNEVVSNNTINVVRNNDALPDTLYPTPSHAPLLPRPTHHIGPRPILELAVSDTRTGRAERRVYAMT